MQEDRSSYETFLIGNIKWNTFLKIEIYVSVFHIDTVFKENVHKIQQTEFNS
jgi:hypothetical protein